MEISRFTEGSTRHEVWDLLDSGWDNWAIMVDQFLTQAIRGIAAEYAGGLVEWLEINYWQNSGRLIVFPSQDGPHGDRGERVCFELSSKHLEAASREISDSVPQAQQATAWATLAERVWRRVAECLIGGAAGVELSMARRSFKLRAAGYDYNPGEGPWRLTEEGAWAG